MCFTRRHSAGTVQTFKLLCVFCALVPSMHGHLASESNSHQHDHHHHGTHLPVIVQANQSHENGSSAVLDEIALRLHRFNRRFESMRQCQLPGSNCQCLWNLKHLRGMLRVETTASADTFHGLAHSGGSNGNATDSSSSGGSTSEGYGKQHETIDNGSLQRQLAVLMVDNVLRLGGGRSGDAAAATNGRWFKCLTTDLICSSRDVSPYATQRYQILATLMPNMAKMETIVTTASSNNNETDEEHHQADGTGQWLQSIELLTDVESLLRQINHQLAVEQQQPSAIKCFDREDLIDDLRHHSAAKSADHHRKHHQPSLLYIEYLANSIVNRLASGECIELFETKFLRDIIARYGSGPVGRGEATSSSASAEHNHSVATLAIHQDGFVKLLNDLHIGGLIESNSNGEIERRIDGDHPDDGSHYHDHHRQQVKPLAASSSSSSRGHRSISRASFTSGHNHIGHRHEHQHQQPPRSSSACLDYRYYLHRQGDSKVLTAADLRELSPIFVQQILSGACEHLEPSGDHFVSLGSPNSKLLRDDMMDSAASLAHNASSSHSGHHANADDDEVWKMYLYSSVTVLIISISSICGVLLIPFLKSQYYSHLINLLIGLAFGCMAGDALFHLLPTVLGIHSHGSKADAHEHPHDHNNPLQPGRHEEHHEAEAEGHDHATANYMGLMVAILATIYVLFLFEIISNFIATKKKGLPNHNHGHSHGHSHQQPSYETTNYKSASSVPTLTKITTTSQDNCVRHNESKCTSTDLQCNLHSSNQTINSTLSNSNTDNEQEHLQTLQRCSNASPVSSLESMALPDSDRAIPVFMGMTSLALIITIGDSIHNLLDGVAIGIAFSNSIASGISTSIAVFCHELPHEFGDFAVLLSTGLTVRRAAVINFFSALTAFIGLYIGILLGNNDAANRWALAICAGLFLYVALVDMLPELKVMPTEKGNREWITSLLVKNVGILLGIAFMIILAKYEELLNFA